MLTQIYKEAVSMDQLLEELCASWTKKNNVVFSPLCPLFT